MLRNEPLLFVKGPPVFIKVVVKDEESTSVFVGNEDKLEVVGEVAQEVLEDPGYSSDARKSTSHKKGKSINCQEYPLSWITICPTSLSTASVCVR